MAYQVGEYPLPKAAVYVWIAQGKLCIRVPPADGHEKGHTVQLSLDKCGVEYNDSGTAPKATQQGWYAFLRLLHDRETSQQSARIGAPGAQTQWQMEQMLKAMAGTDRAAKQISPDGHHVASLAELGLDSL